MTLKQRLDALLKASSETITPAESVRSYREYAVACAEAYRAGLLVARETTPEPQRAPQTGESAETNPDQPDATPWEVFRCLLPRKIEGEWHCFSLAERRTVYPHGALGILTGSVEQEYRKCRA